MSLSSTGVILGQNCVWLSDAALNGLFYFFFKNLFYQRECKYARNIGVAQSRGALL